MDEVGTFTGDGRVVPRISADARGALGCSVNRIDSHWYGSPANERPQRRRS